MRGAVLPLALLGMALAAPLESRQSGGIITIGDPGSGGGLIPSEPSEGCDQEIWEKTGYCVIPGPLRPPTKARRGDGIRLDLPKDENADIKAAVRQAQLELQALQAKEHPSRADLRRVEALRFFVEKASGVVKISPPSSGGSTVLVPGKRAAAAAVEERQSGKPCLVDLEKYAKELQEFLLSFPPWERARIWAQLIQGVCGIQTGPIVPDPTTPGAPIKPDPVSSGAPMKPDTM